MDGAGQINMTTVKSILDNNTFTWRDLADSDFTSCGTGCRAYLVRHFPIAANASPRIALAWQACMTAESGTPTLNNDLDLAVTCGSSRGDFNSISNTVTSELEMIQVLPSTTARIGCSLQVRIKNGATLAPCGSTTTERIGVAWTP